MVSHMFFASGGTAKRAAQFCITCYIGLLSAGVFCSPIPDQWFDCKKKKSEIKYECFSGAGHQDDQCHQDADEICGQLNSYGTVDINDCAVLYISRGKTCKGGSTGNCEAPCKGNSDYTCVWQPGNWGNSMHCASPPAVGHE